MPRAWGKWAISHAAEVLRRRVVDRDVGTLQLERPFTAIGSAQHEFEKAHGLTVCQKHQIQYSFLGRSFFSFF